MLEKIIFQVVFFWFFKNKNIVKHLKTRNHKEPYRPVHLEISPYVFYNLIEFLSFLSKHYSPQSKIRIEICYYAKTVYDQIPKKTSIAYKKGKKWFYRK